jgi:hypothetical protein
LSRGFEIDVDIIRFAFHGLRSMFTVIILEITVLSESTS